jgi:ribosomal protein L11 methyltransferase
MKIMNDYKSYKISTNPFVPEILSGLLWNLPIEGISEEDNFLLAYHKLDKNIKYQQIEIILENLKSQSIITDYSITTEIIKNRNWNKEWEKRTPVIEITEKIVVKPSFKDYHSLENGKIVLEIDPKMSFGTGEHQTTKLMIKMMEKYIVPNSKILDIGTGTGILAIAAAKLVSPKFILGIDNDEWCFLNSRENIKLNEVEKSVEFRLTEIQNIPEKDFDLILANINKGVLIDISSTISNKLNSNGTVILSGLLHEDENDIIREYKKFRIKPVDKLYMDEWVCIAFKK